METRTSPFLPALQLSVALFATAPEAAAALHAALLAAGRASPEEQARMRYACLDARTLVSRAHVDAALDAAALALAHGSARCHTREAEVVFRIAAGNNIGDALRTFGLSPTSTHVLLVHLGPTPADGGRSVAEQLAHMQALLPGAELLPLAQLGAPHIVDWARVRKAYKLRDLSAGSDAKDEALQRRIRAREIDCVVGAVACKAVM